MHLVEILCILSELAAECYMPLCSRLKLMCHKIYGLGKMQVCALCKCHSARIYSLRHLSVLFKVHCRSHWLRGLRRRSSVTPLLRFWVRIPPWTWMSLCCECCVLSGRGLCVELITRPEESYRMWCVVWDLETS